MGNHGQNEKRNLDFKSDHFSTDMSEEEGDFTDIELPETEDDIEDGPLLMSESDSEEGSIVDSKDEREVYFTKTLDDCGGTTSGSLSMSKHSCYYENPCLLSEQIPITKH